MPVLTPDMREERRVVTALFADLAGSTEITERFDPEDAREVLGGAIAKIIDVVDAYGGTIKDLAGDGVLALFGAPVAHEDDAERAVLAGLEIARAVADFAGGYARQRGCEALAVRVGIESGLAVVGAVGSGSRVEYGAVGDAVNSAARLQSRAEPGMVLVGEATRSATESRFEWGPAESLVVKGKSAPIRAAAAIRQARPPDTDAWAPVTIGRAEELAVLAEAVDDLRGGRGALVLIVGEAGVGKTRLLSDCRAMLVDGSTPGQGVCWLEGHCRSYADAIPYALYQDLLCRWLGVRGDDPAERKRTRLERALADLPAIDEYRALLLAHVLGVTERPIETISPSALKQQAFEAVLSLVRHLAGARPVAVALEDLHWADPTSLALTERLLALPATERLLVVATRRSEEEDASGALFQAEGWHDRVLHVGLLPVGGDVELLRSLIGDVLPGRLERAVIETSERNPFFLEQQVKALVDRGAVMRAPDGWHFRGGEDVEIPETVEKVILSRLDRLGPAPRRTLVAASVLGRGFTPEVLETLVDDPSTLAADLAVLVRVGLVDRRSTGGGGDYRFAHAVIQETAYRSLLRRDRRELHGRAGAAIERLLITGADQAAGMIGHHFAEAGDAERAIPYLATAGDRAKAAYANEEAIASYQRALGLIEDSDAADESRELRADLLAQLGDVLRLVGRHDEARSTFERSLEAVPAGDAHRRAHLQIQLGRVEDELHRYEAALQHWACAEQELSELPEDEPGRWETWFDIQDHRMTTLYWLGDTAAIDALAALLRPEIETRGTLAQRGEFFGRLAQARLRRNRYVADREAVEFARAAFAAVLAGGKREAIAWERFALGFVLVFADEFDEAEAMLTDALAEAARMGDARLRSRCLTYLLVIGRRRGDVERVRRSLGDIVEAARAAHLPEYEAIAIANESWVAWRDGRLDEAVELGRTALELWQALPVRYWYDWMALWPMSAVALARGDVPGAIERFRAMLVAPQQPLPTALAEIVEQAVAAGTAESVRQALDLARHLCYA
ncbi:MAG: ATP-binding protein [Verrucomicrobiota bacterium]